MRNVIVNMTIMALCVALSGVSIWSTIAPLPPAVERVIASVTEPASPTEAVTVGDVTEFIDIPRRSFGRPRVVPQVVAPAENNAVTPATPRSPPPPLQLSGVAIEGDHSFAILKDGAQSHVIPVNANLPKPWEQWTVKRIAIDHIILTHETQDARIPLRKE